MGIQTEVSPGVREKGCGSGMNEKINHLLEQYPIEADRITRVRGGYVLDTPEGLRLLQEYRGGMRKLAMTEKLLLLLTDRGFPQVDLLLRTSQGELSVTDHDGTTYILKQWYPGRECDYDNRQDLYSGMYTLAVLHEKMKGTGLSAVEIAGESSPSDLRTLFRKRVRDMKRIRHFISAQQRKSAFEHGLLQSFDEFYSYALEACRNLEQSEYGQLERQARETGTMIHGSYHYHNILANRENAGAGYAGAAGAEAGRAGAADVEAGRIGTAGAETGYADAEAAATESAQAFPVFPVTNFEKADCGLQVKDIYVFLRKVMEKNHWNPELGRRLLDIYQKKTPLSGEEKKIIRIQMMFPEKYWKLMNYYFNHTKAWLPERNLDKLSMIRKQQEQKIKFLDIIR